VAGDGVAGSDVVAEEAGAATGFVAFSAADVDAFPSAATRVLAAGSTTGSDGPS